MREILRNVVRTRETRVGVVGGGGERAECECAHNRRQAWLNEKTKGGRGEEGELVPLGDLHSKRLRGGVQEYQSREGHLLSETTTSPLRQAISPSSTASKS